MNALGSILAGAADAIHDKVQAPKAIGAQSVLAAATLAVQGHGDVKLPTGQIKPISNFFVTIAESGERKTAADYEALWPVRKREAALREKLAWDRAREHAIKKANGTHSAMKQALDAIGREPPSPLEPMLTCTEPTFEGLWKLLTIGQPSIGIFATEGGQFIGGHGMSADNKLRTSTGLSMARDGDPIRRVRAGEGAFVLPGRRVAIHLMAQPDVVSLFMHDPLIQEQGLLSRTLISSPVSMAGQRLWREPADTSDAALKTYGARLLTIMEMPLPLADGKTNELRPRTLPLSRQSRELWIAFANHIERAISPNGELEPVRGLANKIPEHAARLAAVLTLVNDIEARQINDEQMSGGIELAQHYAGEALRLLGASQISAELRLAQRTLAWLHGSWREPMISLPSFISLAQLRFEIHRRREGS
jgi:hypothetical protein